MRDVWPNACLPKEKRAFLLGTTFASIVGAFLLGVSCQNWSWNLAVLGMCLMIISGFVGPRRFLKAPWKWYDVVLWAVLGIAPMVQLHRSMTGPNVPDAWKIGLGVFIFWTLLQAYIAWFLWHSPENPTVT